MFNLDKELYQYIGKLLKKAREDKNISLDALSDMISNAKTKSTLKRYEDGVSRIDIDTLELICSKLGVDYNQIINIAKNELYNTSNDQAMYSSAGLDYIKVPLYDNLCCGNGGFVEDNIIDYIPVPSAGLNLSKEYFCQYAQGDSMKDAGIIDHDLLVFEKTPIVNNGDIGCFCIDENVATCKKYRETGGIIALVPMNSNYDPIVIDVTSSSFRCLGKLKKSIREY